MVKGTLVYLFLFLFDGLEVGLEVNGFLLFGAQKDTQQVLSRDPHPPQVGPLHFALYLENLLGQILNLWPHTSVMFSMHWQTYFKYPKAARMVGIVVLYLNRQVIYA